MCEFCEPVPAPPLATEPLEGYAAIVQEWYAENVVWPKLLPIIERLVWERMMETVTSIRNKAYA